MIGNSRGKDNLTHLNGNCCVTYGIGPSDSDILTFAAEMQFSNMLADKAHGSIVFEVNYPEGMGHAACEEEGEGASMGIMYVDVFGLGLVECC